jgi:hypothetical protein
MPLPAVVSTSKEANMPKDDITVRRAMHDRCLRACWDHKAKLTEPELIALNIVAAACGDVVSKAEMDAAKAVLERLGVWPMSDPAHNARVQLTATLVNNVAAAFIIAGFVSPVVNVQFTSTDLLWILIGILGHAFGRSSLRSIT